MAQREIPATLAQVHPEAPRAVKANVPFPSFPDEVSEITCPGPLVFHQGPDEDHRRWFECFGDCDLSEETLAAAHALNVVHGCATSVEEELGVSLTHRCRQCVSSMSD